MKDIFKRLTKELAEVNLHIVGHDFNRPWGGFFVLNEQQAQYFADLYFERLEVIALRIGGPLSPKLLVIKPGQRLSWQYHYRRAESWRVIEGQVAVMRSPTDEPGETMVLNPGDQITLACGERHRLIGLEDWAVVAEIWQHTDANHPSDEEDIVRLSDDYGR